MQSAEERTTISELPRGRAYGSMALGLVALLFSPLMVGIIPGLAGLILGGKHLKFRLPARRLAYVGVALSTVGTISSLIPLVLFFIFVWPNMSHVKTVRIPSPFAQAAASLSQAEKQRWSDYAAEQQVALASVSRWIGVPAPDLAFSDVDENEERISDLRGKKVLLAFLEPGFFQSSAEEFPFDLIARLYANAGNAKMYGLFYSFVTESFKREPFISYKFPLRTMQGQSLGAPYRLQAVPVFVVIDRKGIIQHVFGGKEPEQQIQAAIESEDYEGQVQTAPVPGPINGEIPKVIGEFEQVWKISDIHFSKLAVQAVDTKTKSEVVISSSDGYAVYNDEGKLVLSGDLSGTICSDPAIATCTSNNGRRTAIWEDEPKSETGGGRIQVFDEQGRLMWSIECADGPMANVFAWYDLDGNGSRYLCVTEQREYTAIYSESGALVKEWGAAPKGVRKGDVITWTQPSDRPKRTGITPLGLFENVRRGRFFLGVGESDGQVSLVSTGGNELDKWRIEGKGLRFIRAINACSSAKHQKVLVGVVGEGGPCGQRYLSVLDEDGHFLWTRETAGDTCPDGEGINTADCWGNGEKEWLIQDDKNLLLVTADGELLGCASLPTTPGFTMKMDGTGNATSESKDLPPNKIRSVPRPGKSDLILMRSSFDWVAYQLVPVSSG